MKKLSFNIALGGIISALCIVFMFTGALASILVYCVPMLCGFMIAMVYHECGLKTSLVTYVVVSVLSVLLSASLECSFMFLFFFGHYPILRIYIDKIKNKYLRLLVKLLSFNVLIVTAYVLLINLFSVVSFDEFSGDLGMWGAVIFLILGNVVFMIYDRALTVLTYKYIKVIRKKIFKR